VSPIVKTTTVSNRITDLSWQDGHSSARNNALQQGGCHHESKRISAGYGCSGSNRNVIGIASRCLLNMFSIGQQIPSAKYDNNDRTGCSGWNVCHANHSPTIS
jgi:hypothetical protein